MTSIDETKAAAMREALAESAEQFHAGVKSISLAEFKAKRDAKREEGDPSIAMMRDIWFHIVETEKVLDDLPFSERTKVRQTAITELVTSVRKALPDQPFAKVVTAARDEWWPDRIPRDTGEKALIKALADAFPDEAGIPEDEDDDNLPY